MTPEELNERLLDVQDDPFACFVVAQAVHDLTETARLWDGRQIVWPDTLDRTAASIATLAGCPDAGAGVAEWLCDIASDLALERH